MDELRAARKPPHEDLSHEYVQRRFGALTEHDDLPFNQYLNLLSQSRALICPSRWEGLGLHFFEAMSLGIPVISSSIQPITEFVKHESNGLLVSGKAIGHRKNGLIAVEPSIDELGASMRLLEDAQVANAMSREMRSMAVMRSWDDTVKGFLRLMEA